MEKKIVDGGAAISRRAFLAGAGLGLIGFAGALAGCGKTSGAGAGSASSGSSSSATQPKEEPATVRVASLKGPTSIGLVSFMDKAKSDAKAYGNTYEFTISSTPDEILPQVIKGGVDIALVPANAAAVLYAKTSGAVTCLDINTLGVLSVVTGDASVKEFKDLAGHTVYLTGKGATPEYSMDYLLEQAGIKDQVTLEFKSEATEVVSVLASDAAAVGVLPQPFVTAATVKNPALKAVIDLTDVWGGLADKGSQLVTGVTIVRDEFLKAHPLAVREFLDAQKASVKAVNGDPAAAAPLVVSAGIIDAEPVAEKAIPACHLVCITDSEMKDALSGYLDVLAKADASSVGGKVPGDDFYYEVKGA